MSTTSANPFFSDNFDDGELEEFDHVGGKRLQILNQVAKTQFASVFHALDRHTEREVAAKVIMCKPDGIEWRKTAPRIRRELKAWMTVENKSPFILPLIDVMCHKVVVPDQQFIAFVLIMPFAPLETLKNISRQKLQMALNCLLHV